MRDRPLSDGEVLAVALRVRGVERHDHRWLERWRRGRRAAGGAAAAARRRRRFRLRRALDERHARASAAQAEGDADRWGVGRERASDAQRADHDEELLSLLCREK